jgi:hypothetical protein
MKTGVLILSPLFGLLVGLSLNATFFKVNVWLGVFMAAICSITMFAWGVNELRKKRGTDGLVIATLFFVCFLAGLSIVL